MKKTLHKALSMLLTAALVLNMGFVPAFAVDTPMEASGLTDCHTKHDEDCGYSETTTMGGCTHAHGDECGYTEGTKEQPCTFIADEDAEVSPDDAVAAFNAVHIHNDTCGYTPETEGAPCTHAHDGTCGYTESTAVTAPCTHTCEVCTPVDSDNVQEQVCTCEPNLGEDETGHGEDCPPTPHLNPWT